MDKKEMEKLKSSDPRITLIKKGELLFANKSYQEIKICDIEESLGMPTKQLYSFFDSKEAFFLSVLQNRMNMNYEMLLNQKQSGASENTLMSAYRVMLVQIQETNLISAIPILMKKATAEQMVCFWRFMDDYAGNVLTLLGRKPTVLSKKIFLYALALVFSDMVPYLQRAPLKIL